MIKKMLMAIFMVLILCCIFAETIRCPQKIYENVDGEITTYTIEYNNELVKSITSIDKDNKIIIKEEFEYINNKLNKILMRNSEKIISEIEFFFLENRMTTINNGKTFDNKIDKDGNGYHLLSFIKIKTNDLISSYDISYNYETNTIKYIAMRFNYKTAENVYTNPDYNIFKNIEYAYKGNVLLGETFKNKDGYEMSINGMVRFKTQFFDQIDNGNLEIIF
jgi:hypothetical protein